MSREPRAPLIFPGRRSLMLAELGLKTWDIARLCERCGKKFRCYVEKVSPFVCSCCRLGPSLESMKP